MNTTNASNNDVPVLTNFPLLDLPKELPLKVYELLVTFPDGVCARELMQVNRATSLCAAHLEQFRSGAQGQPNISKVSRQVRKDALGLYYSLNTFYMDGNVTEHSCLYPFTRYPSPSSTVHLRQIRSISCLLKLSDRCPNPANQHPKRYYNLEVTVSLSKNKNKLLMKIDNKNYETPERKTFLLRAIKDEVGEPENGKHDGLYLLKTAVFLFDGVMCHDRRPKWRDMEIPPAVEDSQLLFGPNAFTPGANAQPLATFPAALGNYINALCGGNGPLPNINLPIPPTMPAQPPASQGPAPATTPAAAPAAQPGVQSNTSGANAAGHGLPATGYFFDMFLSSSLGPPIAMGTFGPVTTGHAASTATTSATASSNAHSSATNATQAATAAGPDEKEWESKDDMD